MNQNRPLLLLLAAISLTLSGCSEKKPEIVGEAKTAVHINGQPILDAEVQSKYAMRDGTVGTLKPVSAQAMESLVNMELMRQAAVQGKLDNEEQIKAKILISMRSILATAYMEQLLSSVTKPSDAEISTHFSKHPERYAERKQYAVQEFKIQANPAQKDQIKAQLGQLKNHDQFDTWLKQSNIPHQSNPLSVMTDAMPDSVLEKFSSASVGGHVVLDQQEPLHVIFLLSEQQQPATLEQVAQLIGNTLFEQRRKDALEGAIKQLRDKAKIEYAAPYTAQGLQVASRH